MYRKNHRMEITKTQVLVLAGGKAKRMGIDFPKCLLEISGKKLIDRCIESLTKEGFREFVFLIGYKHELVIQHIGDGSKYGIVARYSIDPDSNIGWGKGKALKYALQCNKINRSKRSMIVFPDDVILEKNFFSRFLTAHLEAVHKYDALATIALVPGMVYPYGVATVGSRGMILRFTEKPYMRKPTSVGIYVIEPQVYELVEEVIDLNEQGAVELEGSILPVLARQKRLFSFFIAKDKWLPINTLKEYQKSTTIDRQYSSSGRNKPRILSSAKDQMLLGDPHLAM